jgi:HPt (histidine-containing phosphotransfer) domain-containing protein
MLKISQTIAPIYSQLADDPDLYGIVKMFVEEMPTRMERLIKEYDEKNWGELKNMAHQLRGAAGCYGFGEVAPAAGRLEQSLKNELPEEEIQQSLAELLDLCRRMAIN